MNTVELIKGVLLRSGTEWVLWLLLALSVASVAVAVERLVVFRRKTRGLLVLASALETSLGDGGLEKAAPLVRDGTTVAASVARAGLSAAPRGVEAAERAMQRAFAMQRAGLEARLAFLGTLGNNAPFLGLFGTVIGVVSAFEELGRTQGGASGAASQVASSAVMGAIAEALVATAVGIGVALPAVVFYNYFQRAIERLSDDVGTVESVVLEHVHTGASELAREAA